MVLGAGGVEPRPYGGLQEGVVGRADAGIGPYGSITRGAMGGRPQGSPLRKRNKKCGGERNPPVGFVPFRLGVRGRGERIATASVRTGLAMTGFCKGCGGVEM